MALVLSVVGVMVLLLGMPAAAFASTARARPSKTGSDCAGTKSAAPSTLTSGIPTQCESSLLTYLVKIPNFADPSSPESANLDNLEGFDAALAVGLMGAVVTISVAGHFLAGVARGGGGAEVVEGLGKAALAIGLVVAWPVLFAKGVTIANAAGGAVLNAPGVVGAAGLFTQLNIGSVTTPSIVALLGSNPVGWLADVIIVLLTVVALVGVMILKIGLSASTAFLYAAAPIAIVLWPVEQLRWVTETVSKTATACVLIPLIWALLFAVFSVVGVDAITNPVDQILGGTWWATVSHQVVAIALLYALIAVPRGLLRQATGGVGGGGGIGRQMFSYAAGGLASQSLNHVVNRTVTRLHGPQAVVTRDAQGQISSYTETTTVRGKGREAARAELAPAQQPEVRRAPGEPAAAFELRVGRTQRAGGRGRVGDPRQLSVRLQSMTEEQRQGVRGVFNRLVLAQAPGTGRPARNYDEFGDAMARAAGSAQISPASRQAYRDLATATPAALDQVLTAGPSAGSGSASGPTGAPMGPPAPAMPRPGRPLLGAGVDGSSSDPVPGSADGAERAPESIDRDAIQQIVEGQLRQMRALMDTQQQLAGDAGRRRTSELRRQALRRAAVDPDLPLEARRLYEDLAGAEDEVLERLFAVPPPS